MSKLALKLVKKCLETRDPHLDLGNCALTDDDFVKGGQLDREIANCLHLHSLVLGNEWWDFNNRKHGRSNNSGNNNSLSVIPTVITRLQNLQRLIICGSFENKFGISDMSAVACLQDLIYLDVSCSSISKINGLERLSNLQSLSLQGNQINFICGLENLSKLQSLDLSNNQITNVGSLECLSNLHSLTLGDNRIIDMGGLENLAQLRFLSLNGNQITCIRGLEKLSNLRSLSLDGNQINGIMGLEYLSQLLTLSLGNNQITKINGLENLSQLTHLNLEGNLITRITGIKNLSQLRNLFLTNNEVTFISGLENLSNLCLLSLDDNHITSMNGLENLSQLTDLYLDGNQITSIKDIGSLSQLTDLYLDGNQITDIDPLKNLSQLRGLYLGGNQITDVSAVGNLSRLESLDFESNMITDLRPLLSLLKKNAGLSIVFKNSYLPGAGEINIGGNPLISPPVEIVKQGNNAVINYFKELEDQGMDYLYEAKMLIIGQPRAGKSSLRYKLFDSSAILPAEDKTTRGIDIQRLNFDLIDRERKSRKFYYNVWDFGGQHIYQTTHQFFLTHRSLYVLVMDTGKDSIGNDDATINYWLQAVELLGGNSPLVLVRNEKNERKVNIDLTQKRGRFEFLKSDFGVDLNGLIPQSSAFSEQKLKDFNHLKDNIEYELKHLPLVGFPMPKNWLQIRNDLQNLAVNNHYITKKEFMELCEKHDVVEYNRQMELSRIFHDLGIFLHFQDYNALDDFIILQNTWATDAVFVVLDNKEVQDSKGRFTDADLAEIWKDKDYEPTVHKKLLALMMQFELCYLVDQSKPNTYIIPEMLANDAPEGYHWQLSKGLPLQYRYDFMPKGILTRFIVRMHRHIARHSDDQCVWKTGVKIDGASLGYPNTFAEITEAWDNKQLNIRVQGSFIKELMSVLTFQVDSLNHEYFRQVENSKEIQKSRWYKMIPCICVACKDSADKHFYDYQELMEMKEFGVPSVRCKKRPYAEVSISALIDGVFANVKKQESKPSEKTKSQTIKIFLASSSELKEERQQFEIFINRENKWLNEQGVFLRLEIWEDFLDAISQTRLQDEYNKVIESCDIFVMLFFTKVGKYTAEEFERAFKQFKEMNKPKIFTYFKSADLNTENINRRDVNSLLDFKDKLTELGHFYTTFKNNEGLHLHFKKQLERLYGL